MSLWIIFLTGLTIGGITCLAVQGGLLASTIAARNVRIKDKTSRFYDTLLPVASFLTTKLIIYTILGITLGAFGKALQFSDIVGNIMQFMAGVYMIVIALDLLQVHPIFRYGVIQPPHFLNKFVSDRSKSKEIFGPALLGLFTVFIPCGSTLAMEVLAISSRNPLTGGLIMATFILGTTPLFFSFGFLTSTLSAVFRKSFLRIAAILLIYIGIISINGVLVATDASFTLEKLWQLSPIEINLNGNDQRLNSNSTELNGVQTVNLQVSNNGYFPNYVQVKKGELVHLNLNSQNAFNCASSFRIPALGVSKNLPPTGYDSVEFIPDKTGKFTFSCAQGFYTGTIEVI
jgi:sulfite exporter TauE/SafE